jgi:peptidoglycan/xylan/chitin deacetylase (PgdA/CDA1 family)
VAGQFNAPHGYLHDGGRAAPDAAAEQRRLLRGLEALDTVLGVRPIGYRGPNWELSYDTLPLLARHGFRYDTGLMDADHPYRVAVSAEPGAPSIVELPAHWSLDDWEPYNYLPGITGSGVIASPDDVIARWTLELEALVREGGLFMLTNHPFVSGRASRAEGLARLVDRAREIDGLWIATCAEIAAHVETLPLEPVVHRRPELPPA